MPLLIAKPKDRFSRAKDHLFVVEMGPWSHTGLDVFNPLDGCQFLKKWIR